MKKILSLITLIVLAAGCSTMEPGDTSSADTSKDSNISASRDPAKFSVEYKIDEAQVSAKGRFLLQRDKFKFNWPSSGFSFSFTGTGAAAKLSGTDYSELYYDIFVDNEFHAVVKQIRGQSTYVLCDDLPFGEHTVSVRRRTEAFSGVSILKAIYLQEDATMLPAPSKNDRQIIFIGDSLSCGYGVEIDDRDAPFELATENSNKCYGAFAAREVNADYQIIAESGRGLIRNCDNSTDRVLPQTYPMAIPTGTYKDQWDFSKDNPDLIVINLGTNDVAPGLPDGDTFVQAYVDFILELQKYHSNSNPEYVLVAGPALSNHWPQDEDGQPIQTLNIFKSFLEEAKNVLTNKYGLTVHTFEISMLDPEKGYGANWHPNEWQQKKNGMELAGFIKVIMNW